METPVEISSGLVFYGKPHLGVVKMLFGAPNKDMGGFMKRLKRVKNVLDYPQIVIPQWTSFNNYLFQFHRHGGREVGTRGSHESKRESSAFRAPKNGTRSRRCQQKLSSFTHTTAMVHLLWPKSLYYSHGT